MITSGITAQYGFLFQREAFILCLLENISGDKTYKFEGKDDIEINVDEKIYAIDVESHSCFQVKSGMVNLVCFKKVIGNWLLLDDIESNSFILLLEKNFAFKWTVEIMVDEMISFAKDGNNKKKSAISRKVYERYKDDIENNESRKLKEDVGIILENLQINVYSIEDLELRLNAIFFDNYCSDIINFEIAKKKRLEKFLADVNQQIDDSIKNKKTFCLTYQNFIKLIMEVTEEINDHAYKVDVISLKKRFRPHAEEIVEEKKEREVRQLFVVDHQEEFVVKEIVNELFYKDFREMFIDHRSLDISNLEAFAKENYDDAKNELGLDYKPRDLYFKTVSKSIGSQLLPEGPMYRSGCYVYLTGEEIDEEIQITWGDENEIE